jgi:hypothetical protein
LNGTTEREFNAMAEQREAEQARQARIEASTVQQLARSIKRNSHLANRLSLMRKAFEMLNAAVTNGQLRVIDGVLHYDHETKLADYCEGVLRQDDQLKAGQDDSAREGPIRRQFCQVETVKEIVHHARRP